MKRIGRMVLGLGVWMIGSGGARGAVEGPSEPAYCVFFDRIEKGQGASSSFFAANVGSEAEALSILAKSEEVENESIEARGCAEVAEAMMVPKLWAPICTDFPAPRTEYSNVYLLKKEVLLLSSKLGEVEARYSGGLCPPSVRILRKEAHSTVEVSPGDLVALELERGPVHPCAGGLWMPETLRYDRDVLKLDRVLVVDNPDCPEGMVGCQRDMDEVRLRVVGEFPTLVYLSMEPAPDFCPQESPRDFWVVLK